MMGAGESSHREASARKTGTRQQRPDLRNKVKIATWNTLTLAKPGHQEVLIQELGRMHIDIAGITEARLTDSGCSIIDDYTIFHSGGAQHVRGVALVITTALARSVQEWQPISDRLLLARLSHRDGSITLIVAYAPTEDSSQADKDDFYHQLG